MSAHSPKSKQVSRGHQSVCVGEWEIPEDQVFVSSSSPAGVQTYLLKMFGTFCSPRLGVAVGCRGGTPQVLQAVKDDVDDLKQVLVSPCRGFVMGCLDRNNNWW